MRTSQWLLALGTLAAAHVAAAQTSDPMPGPAAVAAAVEGHDVKALEEMFGARVELTDPSHSGLKGYLEIDRMVDKLQGCVSSHNGEDGQKVHSFMITFDCPRPDGFEIGADCATEDFKLRVIRRSEAEVARYGMFAHWAVLAPVRSNDGECYRPPIAPPALPMSPRPAKPSYK